MIQDTKTLSHLPEQSFTYQVMKMFEQAGIQIETQLDDETYIINASTNSFTCRLVISASEPDQLLRSDITEREIAVEQIDQQKQKDKLLTILRLLIPS